MLNFYKTMENKLVQLPKEEEGCWVRVTRPTQDEIEYLVERLGLDSGFVSASLDEEEASRMEKEDDQTFVVVGWKTRKPPSPTSPFLWVLSSRLNTLSPSVRRRLPSSTKLWMALSAT